MFQFPGFAPGMRLVAGFSAGRVAPFGNPRLVAGICPCARLIAACRLLGRPGCPIRKSAPRSGYLPLRAAYRSLSRPSSPPRAKASFMCPSLISLCCARHAALGRRAVGSAPRCGAAYRSLSRPSSPPRAKASFMCPSLISLCCARHAALGRRAVGSAPRCGELHPVKFRSLLFRSRFALCR